MGFYGPPKVMKNDGSASLQRLRKKLAGRRNRLPHLTCKLLICYGGRRRFRLRLEVRQEVFSKLFSLQRRLLPAVVQRILACSSTERCSTNKPKAIS